MPRPMREFCISRSAEQHILEKHGLCFEEVLEAAESSVIYQPAGQEDALSLNPTGQRRYFIAGRTEGVSDYGWYSLTKETVSAE